MLKDEVKKLLDSKNLSNEDRLNKIVDLIVNDYWKYSKDEIKELSKELAYKLMDACVGKTMSYNAVFDDLRTYYLDEE